MKTFKTTVNNNNMYRRYVEVVDTLTKLSEREKDIFAILLKIQREWKGDRINIINRDSRKEIIKNTYVSKSNLSKYIRSLEGKNVLVDGEWGTEINPHLFPNFNLIDNPIINKDGTIQKFVITYIFNKNE